MNVIGIDSLLFVSAACGFDLCILDKYSIQSPTQDEWLDQVGDDGTHLHTHTYTHNAHTLTQIYSH